MRRLDDTLAKERSRLFVGRDAEFASVKRWIIQDNASADIVFISGMGGVGKSSFMLKALDSALYAGLRAIWMDGRLCKETPAGFLDALRENMQASGYLPGQDISIQALTRELSGSKTLLCIDNYEAIQTIDGWLREVFLSGLPDEASLLVLFVSRQNLSEPWQHSLTWRNRVHHMPLYPFDKREMRRYLYQCGIDKSEEMERLLAETRGLPLALAMVAERSRLDGSSALPLSSRVSAELLREAVAPELLDILELLCILPQATPGWLERLLSSPPGARQLLQLSRLSFVRPTVDGFALHDVARHYLLEDMMRRNPERVRLLRTRIVGELVQEIKFCDAYHRSQLVLALFSACRDAFQLDSVAVFSTQADHMQLSAFQRSDLPYLKRILQAQADLAVSVEHDLVVLEELAKQHPDTIRVFRSAEGSPLAFFAGFYMYKDTVRFHERFFPGVLQHAYPDEIEVMRHLSIEQADTFYQLLGGITQEPSDYTYQELFGIILADSLIWRYAGLRNIMINTYDGLNEILLRFGYRMRPLAGLPDNHPFCDAVVRELDWRGSDMADEIIRLLGADALHSQAPSVHTRLVMTEKAVKEALLLVGDSMRLGQTGLASILGISGEELHQLMRKLLWEEPMFPLDARMQLVLRQMSEKPHLTVEAAAAELHVSRATYYRIRGQAIAGLQKILLSYGAKR